MVDILVINYLEREFAQTLKCVEHLNGHKIIVDRTPRGVGSLAAAINKGFKEVKAEHFLVVTNCTFSNQINNFIHTKGYVAIQPTFTSDHAHLRYGSGIKLVPFTEFTCVLLDSASFDKLNGVDELMPYVGFDIDFGIRANKIGRVACDFNYYVEHTYNRKLATHPITQRRKMLRRAAERSTKMRLKELYGINTNQQLTTYKWNNLVK